MTRTVEGVKDLIKSCLDNVIYAGDYIISNYNDRCVMFSLSEHKPQIVIHFFIKLNREVTVDDILLINRLNANNTLGSHIIDTKANCYFFTASQFLWEEISKEHFFSLLEYISNEVDSFIAEFDTKE